MLPVSFKRTLGAESFDVIGNSGRVAVKKKIINAEAGDARVANRMSYCYAPSKYCLRECSFARRDMAQL